MNYLWGGMILIGIIYGTVTGHLEEVSEAAIQSSKEAVSLCVVMAGVTALWVGMMRIAEKSGLLEAMEQRMQPVLNFLFPEIPGNHPSRKSIATNLLANILYGVLDPRMRVSDGRTVGSGRRAAEKKTAGGSCGCSK